MNNVSDAELTRLFRIRNTVLKMLSKRGYVVNKSELEISLQQFREKLSEHPGKSARDAMTLLVTHEVDPTDVMFVFLADDEKAVGTKTIETYAKRMMDDRVPKAILIYRNTITSFARKLLAPGELPNCKMEIFKESELLVDITEHKLVPQHVVLTAEEKQEVLSRYKLKEQQLPKIQQSDPVARYFGLSKGQVVKIIRTSETAGRYITYRVCI